jgi:hypothetical protein
MKLTTHLHLEERIRMVEQYLYSPTRLHGVLLNKLFPVIILPYKCHFRRILIPFLFPYSVNLCDLIKSMFYVIYQWMQGGGGSFPGGKAAGA